MDLNIKRKERKALNSSLYSSTHRNARTIKLVSLRVRRIFLAVFVAACILAVPFFLLGAEYRDIFVAAKNPLRDASLKFTTEEIRAFWAASGLFTTIAWILFLVGIIQFVFFAGGLWKHIHRLKRHKEKALERLDYSKKEHMLLGTYDASK